MSTPLSRNTLSNAKEPAIWSCPALGVLSLRPGASSAMFWMVRPVASLSMRSALKLAPTTVDSSTEGATAVTVMFSATVATFIVVSTEGAVPSAMLTGRSTVANPDSVKVSL
jgi:hypothetical protein